MAASWPPLTWSRAATEPTMPWPASAAASSVAAPSLRDRLELEGLEPGGAAGAVALGERARPRGAARPRPRPARGRRRPSRRPSRAPPRPPRRRRPRPRGSVNSCSAAAAALQRLLDRRRAGGRSRPRRPRSGCVRAPTWPASLARPSRRSAAARARRWQALLLRGIRLLGGLAGRDGGLELGLGLAHLGEQGLLLARGPRRPGRAAPRGRGRRSARPGCPG